MAASRRIRSAKVRTDGSDFLVEGAGQDYGWVANYGAWGGTLGDYDPGGARPSWWVGSDNDHYAGGFFGIGPNGPGNGGWYAPEYPGGNGHHGWWNRPHSGQGLLASVTRCTTVLVQPIIRTPWAIEGRDGPEVLPSWVKDPQLMGKITGDTVSLIPAGLRMTGHNFWATVLTHSIWWGAGFFMFKENAQGQPTPGSMSILNPFMVGVDNGRFVLDPHGENPVGTDFDGRFSMRGDVWRVTRVMGTAPHDHHTPSGVLVRHFDTLRLGAAVQSYAADTFATGIPSGFLKVTTPNFPQDQAQALKKSWMDTHGKGKRSVAVLNAQVDYTPVTITPVDADLDKVKKFSLMDVAHAFGLSSAWLDIGGDSLTYANMVDRRRDLLDHSLTGYAQPLMECLTAVLPYGTTMRVNWAAYTAPDLQVQIPAMAQAISVGLVSIAEARKLMGLQDVESGPEPDVVTDNHPMEGGADVQPK